MSAALDVLNANIAQLNTTADQIIAALQAASNDPAVQSAADAVAAVTTKLQGALPPAPQS